MLPRRNGQDDSREIDASDDDTAIAFQALRAGASPTFDKPAKLDDDKISLFWRVFGGTILSIIALAAVTLFNNISSSISELRNEVARANEVRTSAIGELRNDMAKAAEARADLVRKDEFNSRMTHLYERLQGVQGQDNLQTATLTSFRTEIDGLKERVIKSGADAETVRKEATLALDGLKKDIATVELLKEKLTALGTDVKTTREELQKMRQDVDKNQAYDFERRDRRDAQYKQIDELMKELQKTVQDCRERVARLEAVAPMNGTKKDKETMTPTKEEKK